MAEVNGGRRKCDWRGQEGFFLPQFAERRTTLLTSEGARGRIPPVLFAEQKEPTPFNKGVSWACTSIGEIATPVTSVTGVAMTDVFTRGSWDGDITFLYSIYPNTDYNTAKKIRRKEKTLTRDRFRDILKKYEYLGGVNVLFNSYIFVLVFFPLCLLGYFFLNSRKYYTISHLFLLLMSLWFYGYFNLGYMGIILASIIVNYGTTRGMYATSSLTVRRILLILAMCANIGALFYFKYLDFSLKILNDVFSAGFVLQNILLPLGISFFTFQQVSYVLDVYLGG